MVTGCLKAPGACPVWNSGEGSVTPPISCQCSSFPWCPLAGPPPQLESPHPTSFTRPHTSPLRLHVLCFACLLPQCFILLSLSIFGLCLGLWYERGARAHVNHPQGKQGRETLYCGTGWVLPGFHWPPLPAPASLCPGTALPWV